MKNDYRKPLSLCCLMVLFLWCVDLSAQGKGFKRQGRFKAGVMVGLNMAQIDGDKYRGYRRPGLQAGLVGITVLNRNNILTTELMFSQRGSRPSSEEIRDRSEYQVRIRLNYAEVPVIFHHLYKEREDGSFHHSYHAGLSFARLVSTRIEEKSFNAFSTPRTRDLLIKDRENIRNNDICLIFGGTLYLNKYVGITLRSTFSLLPFYVPVDASALRSYYLTLSGGYYFH